MPLRKVVFLFFLFLGCPFSNKTLTVAFPKLLLLNEIWTSDLVENSTDVPAQRGLLLVKKVLSWFSEELPPEVLALQSPGLLCAIMRMSKKVLPILRKLQGSFWHDLFAAMEYSFSVLRSPPFFGSLC